MDGESDENLFGDDSDQESIHNQVSTDNGPQAPDLDEELFGDFDDDEQVTQNEPATYADEVDENHQDLFEEQRDDHEYTYDRAELPNILGPKDNSNLFLLKIPKFLNIESKPFDPETFIPQDEEERVIKTTVRWRHGLNENESNARVVRWSDGSFSLLVGDESFDVTTTDIKDRNQFLTFQHPDEGFLQTQARLSQFMSFTPSSTSAVSHKLMMTQVSKLNRKGKRTKQYIINEDPEEIARKAEKVFNLFIFYHSISLRVKS
ncbi:Leo1-like protein-domain-containing protein [Globomyces pollinis-pini]|nr:Leo1-like protein-domain-containing protein [Globomyces pollinis-pini]